MRRDRRLVRVLCFLAGVAIFTPLAIWRAGDLRHVVTTPNARGGRVRHEARLEYGRDRYTVLVTGRNGLRDGADLRIAVEGDPAIPFTVHSNYPPVIDLGLHHFPEFTGDELRNLQPGDRIGLWVVLRPGRRELPADRILDPTRYSIVLRDAADRTVLTVPVEFHDPRAPRPKEHS